MSVTVETTMNPLDKGANISYSNGNRTMAATGVGSSRSYTKVSSGKWYFEVTRAVATQLMFGVSNATANLGQYPGNNANSVGLYNGTIYANGSVETEGALSTTGVFGVALDADARTIRFFNASGTTTARAIGFTGDIYIAMGSDGGGLSGTLTLNTGQAAFTYSVPSGYTSGFALRTVYQVLGSVKDASGANVARTVQAHLRSTGALVGTVVSDGSTGNFTLEPEPNGTAELVLTALPVSSSENALVFDRVVPG